jgi:hypothetical protein
MGQRLERGIHEGRLGLLSEPCTDTVAIVTSRD